MANVFPQQTYLKEALARFSGKYSSTPDGNKLMLSDACIEVAKLLRHTEELRKGHARLMDAVEQSMKIEEGLKQENDRLRGLVDKYEGKNNGDKSES